MTAVTKRKERKPFLGDENSMWVLNKLKASTHSRWTRWAECG